MVTEPKGDIKSSLLTKMTVPDMTIKYLSEATDHQLTRLPNSIAVTNGHLILDGNLVDHVEYMNGDKLSWTRQTGNNETEYGCLNFHQNRLLAKGFISRTSEPNSTTSKESFHLVATTTNKYKCLRSEKPISKDINTPKMIDFGVLEMGFTHDSAGNPEIIGNITLSNKSPLSSHGGAVNFFVDVKEKLHVDVHFSPTEASFLNYIRLTGEFSYDFSTFCGEAIAYDDNGAQFEGAHYHWKGTLIPTEKSSSHMLNLTAKMAPKTGSVSPHDGTVIHLMMMEAAKNVDQQLSIQELIDIPAPNKDALQQLSFGKLLDLSKFLMTEGVLKDVFGLVRPDIGKELKEIAAENKDFLQNRFAVAYVMSSLKDTATISKDISKDDKRKLEFYLNPNKGDNGINAEKGFHIVNKEIARLAFLEMVPQLQKYISSPQGGEYWAKALLSRITTNSFLNGLAIEQLLPQIQSIVQKYTTILYCLDPKSEYPQKFQESVHSFTLNRLVKYFTGSEKDEEDMVSILGEMFNALLKLVVDDSDTITPEIRKGLMDEMKAEALKFNLDLEAYFTAVSTRFQSASAIIIATMSSSKGPILTRMVDAIRTNRNRFLATAGGAFICKVMPLAIYGVSVYFTMYQYQHWSSLSVLTKASLIANTAGLAFQLLKEVPSFLTEMAGYIDQMIISGGTWISERIITLFDGYVTVERVEAGIESIMESANVRMGARAYERIAESAALNYEVDVWTFSRVAKGSMKVMNTLGLVLATVSIAVTVINDFTNGATVAQKTLDTLQVSLRFT
jgi:hypothetical protein